MYHIPAGEIIDPRYRELGLADFSQTLGLQQHHFRVFIICIYFAGSTARDCLACDTKHILFEGQCLLPPKCDLEEYFDNSEKVCLLFET